MAELLDDDAVRDALATLTDWNGDQDGLSRTAEFASFAEAVAVVDEVAVVADELDHHPDIDIRWRTLTFRCVTHAAGGVTRADVGLARRIEDIVAAYH